MSLHLLKETALAFAAADRAYRELCAAYGSLTISQHSAISSAVINLSRSPREVTQQDYDALLVKLKG